MRASDSKTERVLATLSAIAVAIVLAISTAPAAYSDEHDDAFLDALKRHDILAVGDPAGVVGWAHWACDQLRQGAPKEHVVAWLSQYHPHADNSVFLREAAPYYCPELKSKAGW